MPKSAGVQVKVSVEATAGEQSTVAAITDTRTTVGSYETIKFDWWPVLIAGLLGGLSLILVKFTPVNVYWLVLVATLVQAVAAADNWSATPPRKKIHKTLELSGWLILLGTAAGMLCRG